MIMAPAQRLERLVSVDMLRAVAILAVMVCHLPFSWRTGVDSPQASTDSAFAPAVVAVTRFGLYGVHLFLVISGFCIHMRWASRGSVASEVGFFSFWTRRLRRLYPPYFVALVASLVCLLVLYHSRAASSLGARFGYADTAPFLVDLLLLLLLAQNLNGASERVGNSPFWSLALEEQLYFLYFPLLRVRRTHGWAIAIAMVLMVTLSWRVAFVVWPDRLSPCWQLLGPARWFEWTLGAVAVEAHLGRVKLPALLQSLWSSLALLAAAVLSAIPTFVSAFPALDIFNDLLFGLSFFVLLNWCCGLERAGVLQRQRWVLWLAQIGLWSYSLYLTHTPIMIVTKRFAIYSGLGVPGIVVARMGCALVGGYLYYLLVEKRWVETSRRGAQVSEGLRR